MGKFLLDIVFMLAAGGLGYYACLSHYFGNVGSKKTVRVGDKFFRITKVEMSEKESE